MKNIIKKLLREGLVNDEINVFHGTVYDFEEFKTDNIGTGEGNQYFGWGLYFTNTQDIASTYKANTSKQHNHELWLDDTTVGSKISQYYELLDDASYEDFRKIQNRIEFLEILEKTWDYNKAIEVCKGNSFNNVKWAETHIKPYVKNDIGKIYDVTLHKGKTPDQYDYLTWEEIVPNNQLLKISDGDTNINKALSKWKKEGTVLDSSKPYKLNGRNLYFYLSSYFNSDKKTSLYLNKCGIDGIKYMSNSLSDSNKYEGGFNYVVFDEKSVSINKS
jgi:hypothetical protein